MSEALTAFSPETDGVDHINVYSRAKTVLGRTLSNFAHTPIQHPQHGYFASIEAYWYWMAIGDLKDSPMYHHLRSLYGFKCKEEGRKALQHWAEVNNHQLPVVEDFECHIKKALLCKVQQTEGLADLLKRSTLPLIHYYYWGEKPPYKVSRPVKYDWITDYLSDIRDFLNDKADILVIAGSRQIRDLDLIRSEFVKLQAERKVIEIVSGLASGPDRLGIDIAKEFKLPWAEFPADWDSEPKRAGFIRNAETPLAPSSLMFITTPRKPATSWQIGKWSKKPSKWSSTWRYCPLPSSLRVRMRNRGSCELFPQAPTIPCFPLSPTHQEGHLAWTGTRPV